MDYSKYKYDQEKKERRIKKNQHVTQLKQIRLKPHIDENDYNVKLRQILGFLERKDKVKVNMFFRGREMMYKDLGRKVIERVVVDVAGHGITDGGVVIEGRVMSVVVAPISEKVVEKGAKPVEE